jgi:hypothetical protein
MFRLSAELDRELTDDQRRWAERSGFGRMQTALATIVPAAFDGCVDDKTHCLRVFEQHYGRVRRKVPADRLLDYHVRQGWEPLCRFLGVAVPEEPFPRVNAGDNLLANIRTAMESARAQRVDVVWR